MEALHQPHPELAQARRLRGRLGRLGDGLEAHDAGHLDDGRDEGVRAVGAAEPAHEGAVDLEDVDGQGAQVVERGVAHAEVVDGHAHAHLAPGLQLGPRSRQVADEDVLGDLQHEPARGQPALVEDVPDRGQQLLIAELAGREVDRDDAEVRLRDGPGPGRRAGPAQDVVAQGDDEPRCLGRTDEGPGQGAS